MIVLEEHTRGDDFEYSSTLLGGYVAANFQEFWFTLRDKLPSSTTPNDRDAVAQATLSGGRVVFSSDTAFSVKIAGTLNRHWPAQVLHWDFQGRLTNGAIKTLERGTVSIVADITRAQ